MIKICLFSDKQAPTLCNKASVQFVITLITLKYDIFERKLDDYQILYQVLLPNKMIL